MPENRMARKRGYGDHIDNRVLRTSLELERLDSLA